MYLIIDIGNTRIKTALFEAEKMIELMRFRHDEFSLNIKNIAKKYPIKKAIISSVGKLSRPDNKLVNKLFNCITLDYTTSLPFDNKYASPKTLGVDRLALSAAAVIQYPKKNVLVIDAGTCITYDFVTSENKYLGGAIAPGVRIRYNSLHDYTSNLPLLEKQIPANFIGDTTDASIHSGVVNGICREIDGVISQYSENAEELTVVLTGGDAEFLSGQLKNSIFVRPFFLLKGLYTILKYNNNDKES